MGGAAVDDAAASGAPGITSAGAGAGAELGATLTGTATEASLAGVLGFGAVEEQAATPSASAARQGTNQFQFMVRGVEAIYTSIDTYILLQFNRLLVSSIACPTTLPC
jgi:hypothetical protein